MDKKVIIFGKGHIGLTADLTVLTIVELENEYIVGSSEDFLEIAEKEENSSYLNINFESAKEVMNLIRSFEQKMNSDLFETEFRDLIFRFEGFFAKESARILIKNLMKIYHFFMSMDIC